jgi:hypothetical protein
MLPLDVGSGIGWGWEKESSILLNKPTTWSQQEDQEIRKLFLIEELAALGTCAAEFRFLLQRNSILVILLPNLVEVL